MQLTCFLRIETLRGAFVASTVVVVASVCCRYCRRRCCRYYCYFCCCKADEDSEDEDDDEDDDKEKEDPEVARARMLQEGWSFEPNCDCIAMRWQSVRVWVTG